MSPRRTVMHNCMCFSRLLDAFLAALIFISAYPLSRTYRESYASGLEPAAQSAGCTPLCVILAVLKAPRQQLPAWLVIGEMKR